VSSQLVTQFAECLKRQLGTGEEAGVAVAEASRPVAGVRLGLRAFLSRLGRLFGRKGRS
jgi:hypothetical protein